MNIAKTVQIGSYEETMTFGETRLKNTLYIYNWYQYLSSRIAYVFGKSITSWIVRTSGSGIDSQGSSWCDLVSSGCCCKINGWREKEHRMLSMIFGLRLTDFHGLVQILEMRFKAAKQLVLLRNLIKASRILCKFSFKSRAGDISGCSW